MKRKCITALALAVLSEIAGALEAVQWFDRTLAAGGHPAEDDDGEYGIEDDDNIRRIYEPRRVASTCNAATLTETAPCLDGTGTCLRRCYWEYTETPSSQFDPLSDFAQACGASTWRKAGVIYSANWCDGGTTVTSQGTDGDYDCVDDVIYDPCTGELVQTPEASANPVAAAAWSYAYDSAKAWQGVLCDNSGMVTEVRVPCCPNAESRKSENQTWNKAPLSFAPGP